jgi:hypothetical protein
MIRLIFEKSRLPSALATVKRLVTSPAKSFLSAKPFSTLVKSGSGIENLAKDVIVFNYENPRLFKVLNLFAISQLFFWGYLAEWTYNGMRDSKVS